MDVKEFNAHKNVIISIEMSVNGMNDHDRRCFSHKFNIKEVWGYLLAALYGYKII